MKRRMNPHTGLAPLLLASVMGLLVASCSQDDGQLGDTPSSERVALSLPALYTADAPATRTTTTFPTDKSKGTIGFFVKVGDTDNGYLAINNRPGTYDGAGTPPRNLWVPTPDIWLNNHDADIAVYAPYDAAQSTDVATLALTAGEYTDARDLSLRRLTASSLTVKTLGAPILEHLYSRLTVTFVKDANYAATAKITSLNASGSDIYTSATYDPFAAADAAYTRTGTEVTVTPTTPPTLGTDAAAADAAKIDLLIIPTQQTSLTPVTLTVVMEDGVKMKVELPTNGYFQLTAGMQYEVKLTLISGELVLNSIETVNWDSQTAVDGGGLTPVPTLKLTEPGPVRIGGVEWSAYNCDGVGGFVTKPWEYGYYYTFEEGDGTGGTRCPDGYRQPTEDELRKLVDYKAPAGIAIKINGKKYTTNSFGFIGKDADPNSGLVVKEGANILFLPAAGIRLSNGVMQDAGMIVYYWGNVLLDETHGICTYIKIDVVDLDGYEHTAGLPVRCVKQ